MHTGLALSTLLLLVASCFLLFTKPGEVGAKQAPRWFHLLNLSLPLVGVGLGALFIWHFAQVACFARAPQWDQIISVLLPGGLIGSVLSWSDWCSPWRVWFWYG